MKKLALILLLTGGFGQGSAFANAEWQLKGRSISDNCRFIYRIESDFVLSLKKTEGESPDHSNPSNWSLHYAFLDAYKEIPGRMGEGTVELETAAGERPLFSWTAETMSTRRRELFHDLVFYVERIDLVSGEKNRYPEGDGYGQASFSFLMNRCYPEKRSRTPYQVIDIGW